MRAEAAQRVEREIFVRLLVPAALPNALATKLVELMRDETFRPGEVLYRAGTPADGIFVIITGEVELVKSDELPWLMNERSIIGILDAIQDRPRMRTAIARTAVHAGYVRTEDYFELLEEDFGYMSDAVRGVAAQLHELGASLDDGGFSSSARAPCEGWIVAPHGLVRRVLALRSTPAFRRMPPQSLVRIARVAQQARLQSGDALIHRGDSTDAMWVLVDGEISIEGGVNAIKARCAAYDFVLGAAALGERSYDYEVVAATQSTLLRVSREDLLDIMEDHREMARGLLAWLSSERERVLEQRDVPYESH